MSGSDMDEPVTPGGRMGDDLEKEYLEEAEHDRLGDRTEEIHREEASEEGMTSPKKPWWKFWG